MNYLKPEKLWILEKKSLVARVSGKELYTCTIKYTAYCGNRNKTIDLLQFRSNFEQKLE